VLIIKKLTKELTSLILAQNPGVRITKATANHQIAISTDSAITTKNKK